MVGKCKKKLQSGNSWISMTLFFLFLFSGSTYSATIHCHQGEMFEIPLLASNEYNQPVLDISVKCRFTGKNGNTLTIPGFWNGGRSYLVRYAFQDTGTWSYSISSDPSDDSIDNQSGYITVSPASNSWNPFLTKGRPIVSSNGHYLTHKNGEPFFFLANTCWEMTWKSNLDQVKRFVSNQKKKRYNVAQFVILNHQNMWPWGVINQNGDSAFLAWDFYLPNPRYMGYLDSIVKVMNDSGMIAAIAPLWAATTEVNYNPKGNYWKYMPKDQALKWATYVGSRYAGSNVMWIVAGDNYYPDSNGIRDFWKEFALNLRKASGPDHLISMHCVTGTPSYEIFDNSTKILDFHMYQSSHFMEKNNLTWQLALGGYRLNPPRPVIDDETCYEDIYNNLWQPGDTISVYTYRIQPEHIRKAQYEAILSGSIIGISYGANGVFQWNVPGISPSHNPSFLVDSAWNLPGSYQMSIARSILEKYDWYEFIPAPELIKSSHSSFIPLSYSKKHLVLYLQKSENNIQIDTKNFVLGSIMKFIDPRTGSEYSRQIAFKESGICSITKPDTSDWLAVLPILKTYSHVSGNPKKLSSRLLSVEKTKRLKNNLSISIVYLGSSKKISLELFTLSGRLVKSMDFSIPSSGAYRWELPFQRPLGRDMKILRLSDGDLSTAQTVRIQ